MANEEVDMNRYWYPPGVTEPQLRPEFAAEEAAKAMAEPVKAAKPAKKVRVKKAKAEPAAKKK